MLQNVPRYRLRQTAFWVPGYDASSLPSRSTFGIYDPASSLTEHIALLQNCQKWDFLKQMSFAPVDGGWGIVLAGRECAFASQTGCLLGNPALSHGYILWGHSSKKWGASRYLTVSKMFCVKCTLWEDLCRNVKIEPDTYINHRCI